MGVSRNVVKNRKDPRKVLRGKITQNAKLKSSVQPQKLGSKRKKERGNLNLEAIEVSKDARIVKVDTIKAAKKSTSTKPKAVAKKMVTRKFQKKSVNESEKALPLDSNSKQLAEGTVSNAAKKSKIVQRININKKEESQGKECNKVETNKVSKRVLKRKRPTKEKSEIAPTESQNVSNKTAKVSTGKVDNSRKLKIRKRRKIQAKESEKTVDSLNLNDLSSEHILQCITAIFHLTEEHLKSKNALFDGESYPIFMQVTCIRVPKTPRRQMRILLPCSIVSPNDEIALFVSDLQRGRRKDYEQTVEHYEDLLSKHGCTIIKSIIPMNQVKTEYDQFELKRKLVSSYDHFLVDGRIAGHLSHLLGKEFYKKRKLPTSIRVQSNDLKHEIEHALKKTTMQLHSFGDTHIVQIGNSSMKEEDILENIKAACVYLSKNYPGGWGNIRSIRIKTPTSLSLPIYVTLKNKNSVKVPLVKPKRPKAYRLVTGELTTISGNASVTVTPEGDVTVEKIKPNIKKKKEEAQESDI